MVYLVPTLDGAYVVYYVLWPVYQQKAKQGSFLEEENVDRKRGSLQKGQCRNGTSSTP